MRMRIVLGVCGAWLAAGMLGGGTLQAQERFSREEREDDARDRARALARPLSVTPEERAQGLEQLMATATERFHAGRWDEAKAALDKIFAENPTAEEAVALRAMFGERILMEMALAVQDGRNLGEGPSMLLARANDREREELAGTPERVAAVVDEALRPRERDQFGKVLDRGPMYRLTLLGPYAAPRLIFQMRASPDEAIRVNALLLLANLGPQIDRKSVV